MNDAEVLVLQLRRQLMWDLVQHDRVYDPAVQNLLGFTPASAEVLDAEHEEADLRADRIDPHRERIMLLSSLAATLISRSSVLEGMHESASEEEILAVLTAVIATGSSAILSDLLSCGVVEDPVPQAGGAL